MKTEKDLAYLSSSVQLLKENKFYRIADIVNRTGKRWEQDREKILSDEKYKDTILKKYLTCKKNEPDLECLKKIIKEHGEANNFEKPSANEIVIHLRTGDILNPIIPRHRTMHMNPWRENLFKALPKILKENNIEKVTLVTALHYGANEIHNRFFYEEESHYRSLQYINSIKVGISNITNKETFIFSNKEIDRDFFYLKSANHYIPSNVGSFSSLIIELLDDSSSTYALI